MHPVPSLRKLGQFCDFKSLATHSTQLERSVKENSTYDLYYLVRTIKSYSSQLCKKNIAKQVMNFVKNGTKHWSPELWHGDLIHFSELRTIEIS
jgi:hypothetical protein